MDFTRHLAEELAKDEVRDKLEYVTMSNGAKIKLRDPMGMNHTADRILTSLKNLFYATENMPALNMFSNVKNAGLAGYRKFANAGYPGGATLSNSQGLASTDVVDLAVLTTIESLWQYWCAERSMDTSSTNFMYPVLNASKTAGGFTAGETVISPITAPPLNLFTGNSRDISVTDTLTGTSDTTELGGPVCPGSIEVSDSGNIIAKDDSNGNIFCKGNVATVNYKTGTITWDNGGNTNVAAGQITITAISDRVNDPSGKNIISLDLEYKTKFITATPQMLKLNLNAYNSIAVRKMIDRITPVVGQDAYNAFMNPYHNAIKMLRDAEIASKNNLAAEKLVECTNYCLQYVVDWSSMTLQSFSGTYHDFVKTKINKMVLEMANRTGKNVTAYVVDMTMATMITQFYGFTANGVSPTEGRDGLIGTLDGIPVIRMAYLNGKSRVAEATQRPGGQGGNITDRDPNNYGLIIGVHKSLDSEMAPCVFGEFMAPYTTTVAINADNTMINASTVFCSLAIDTLIPQFVCSMAVKPYGDSLTIGYADPK